MITPVCLCFARTARHSKTRKKTARTRPTSNIEYFARIATAAASPSQPARRMLGASE